MQSKRDHDKMSTLKLTLILLGTAAVIGGAYKIYKNLFSNNDNQ